MTEEEKIKRSRFERNVIAIPYIIFGLIVAFLFIFSPDTVWLVTVLVFLWFITLSRCSSHSYLNMVVQHCIY